MKYFILFSTIILITTQIINTQEAIVGTNIGGWMVLEPWITPSLFYRFLGNIQSDGVAMDSYTFCEALGPEYGNQVMRAHWETFYTEQNIKDLADRGVKMVRLPIGDWTLNPYGPYIGCMDGAENYIDWMFDTCQKYGISILLDVHALKNSQNGFDNSGQALFVEWKDEIHFSHWPNQGANWMGNWDLETQQYTSIDYENVQFSIKNSEDLLKKWGSHPAFGAFEPVNEPWEHSNMDVLYDFYRQTRKLTQQYAPGKYFVFHDAFLYEPSVWNDLFEDTELVALDAHIYQAWNQDMHTTQEFCADYELQASKVEEFKYELWVGEWSLATDVCAMWLGGFNDGNTIPQFQCQWVDCPEEYIYPEFQSGLNREADILGPFGTEDPEYVCIQKGMCSKDSDYFDNQQVNEIAKCALESWNKYMARQFFWTAHNEIEERWDYVKAYDLGWLNPTKNQTLNNSNNLRRVYE